MQARDFQLLVLCGFIRNRDTFAKFSPRLSEDYFETDLQEVYLAMLQQGHSFTVPEVAAQVEGVGGMALVRDIAKASKRYGIDNFTEYDMKKYVSAVEKIGRISHLTELIQAAHDKLAGGKGISILSIKEEKIVSELLSQVSEVQYGKKTKSGFRKYDVFLAEFKDKFDRVLRGEGGIDRIPTGFKSFDKATGGGLPNPGLVVLAGQPGSGKTQLAWQWVLNNAFRVRKNELEGVCAVNSAEMSGVSLASRAVLSAAGLDSSLFRVGDYNNDEEAIADVRREIRRQIGLPIHIDDSEFLTSSIINARTAGLLARFKKLIIVVTDFAEIIADKAESVEQRIANVFINAKALSKLANTTVVLLSQLSRASEASGTKVPSMRHLRYSGMAEAVADFIDLIYAPNQYLESGTGLTPHPDMPPRPDVAYQIIAKAKDGPVGQIAMGWSPTFTRWSSLGPGVKMKEYSGD